MGIILAVHRLGISRVPPNPRRPESFKIPPNLNAKWNSGLTPPSLSCSSVEWNELNKAIRLGCPCYINRIAEGRRIGLSNAVENPTYVEIGDCYQYLGLPRDIEVRVLFTLCFLTSFIFWCCDFGLNCEFDAPGSCIERTQWG